MDKPFIFAELEKKPEVTFCYSFVRRKEYIDIYLPASELNYLINILMTADYTVYVCKYNNQKDTVTMRIFRGDDPLYSVDTGQNEDMYYKIKKACGFIA
ncbi:MAG: hypothetical protein EOM67_08565 [Spirochaetia bacterium]|nr:hypothetical protein [Spirochaetia bacterium]